MVVGYTKPDAHEFGTAGPRTPSGAGGPPSPRALLGELFASAPSGNVTARAATSSRRPPIPKRETLRRSPKHLADCRSSICYLPLVQVVFIVGPFALKIC